MKTTSILTLFIFIAATCFAQTKEFEGRVHYDQSITIHSKEVDSALLHDMFGGGSVYSYKNGKLRWDVESPLLDYQISDLINNVHVLKFLASDSLFKMNYSKPEKLVSYKLTKNAATICGYACDKLETILKPEGEAPQYKRTIWFSSQLYNDPKPFQNLGMYAMNQVMPLIKAVPLAILIENNFFTLRFTGTKVEAVNLSDDLFVIDKSLPMSNSMWGIY